MKALSLSSRRTQLVLLLGLITIERFSAYLFGVGFLPGLATEAGMLTLWGIGHCDTRDGPVVVLAKQALAEKNVNLVLPWVRAEDETEIRKAFDHAQAVRALGPQAQALADEYFLETLVRIHRAAEGAPYTGLKPAGLDLGPAVPAADKALQSGSIDAVVTLLTQAVDKGVRKLFKDASEKQGFDPNDVAAGRKYVEAYVPYVHYIEKIWEIAGSQGSHSQCGGRKADAHLEQHAHHH